MNDPKLKLAMAKLLPEKIYVHPDCFYWSDGTNNDNQILETEWLYVMQLVEQNLEKEDVLSYVNALYAEHSEGQKWDDASIRLVFFPLICSTFNQRATAMCKVKGIEI